MTAIHPQYITDATGNRIFAVLSLEVFESIMKELEELDRISRDDEAMHRHLSDKDIALIRKGEQDIANGRTSTHEEAMNRLNKKLEAPAKTKLSDKYRDVLSKEDARSLNEHTKTMRDEWDTEDENQAWKDL